MRKSVINAEIRRFRNGLPRRPADRLVMTVFSKAAEKPGLCRAFLRVGGGRLSQAAEDELALAAEGELALAAEGAAISGGFSFCLQPGHSPLRRR